MEKVGVNLAMTVASRRTAIPTATFMHQHEGPSHADGATTSCADPGNDPVHSRTQQWFACSRQIHPALGILVYLPIEIRFLIWDVFVLPQPEDWKDNHRKYGSINSPKNLLYSYHDWYRRKIRPCVHQCDAVVTLRHISPEIRLEVERVLFPKTVFRFDSALDYVRGKDKLDYQQISLLRHLHISMWTCDRIWHFSRWRRFCVRPDCKVTDMFSMDTCKTCQWMAIFSAGDLPPTLETITFKFEHDHGQQVYQFAFGLKGLPLVSQRIPVDELSILGSTRSIQWVGERAKGFWYDMLLLEIFLKQAVKALPRVRIKVNELYLQCGECREESERIMAEIGYESSAISSSASEGARI
ncbi:MAG: hypothetical protein L6R37_006468 [Teloschistes peruensis]|nr:MAG: hypothetical protein L6R37_006468 [Teloschistes peruensis]